MTPKQPAPPTGSGGIGQKAEPEETSVESTHLVTIGSGASARRSCLPWSQVGGVRSLSSVLDVELDELALLQGLQPAGLHRADVHRYILAPARVG